MKFFVWVKETGDHENVIVEAKTPLEAARRGAKEMQPFAGDTMVVETDPVRFKVKKSWVLP